MGPLGRLLRRKPDEMTADNFASLATEIEADQKQVNITADDLIKQISALNPEALAWAKWFSQLPVADQDFVEMCGNKGMTINESNFDQVAELVKGQMTED